MNARKYEISDDDFEEILNKMYHVEVSICGYEHQQGSLLRRIDEVSFNQEKSNYEDGQYVCGECDSIYDSEEEAEECCKEEEA